MTQTITLQLSDELLRRYRRGANAARKGLQVFLTERLAEVTPPIGENLPSPVREELKAMESMADQELVQVAHSGLLPVQQRKYSRLLRKNNAGRLTAHEKETLHALGEQARLLTLKKAHALMLLKWRGHSILEFDALQASA